MTLKKLKSHLKKTLLIASLFVCIYVLIYAYYMVQPTRLYYVNHDARVNYYRYGSIFDKFNKEGVPEDVNHCPFRKQVIFAKTHKTGSSTVQNILFRFGQKHNLSFAFPQKNTWMFNLTKPFQANMVWRAGGGNMKTVKDWLHPSSTLPGPFDLFVFHSIWNYPEVQKVMSKSSITITILRDPVDTFESGYSYFGRLPKDINRFVRETLSYLITSNDKDEVERAESIFKSHENSSNFSKDGMIPRNHTNTSSQLEIDMHVRGTRNMRQYFGKNQMLWDLGLDAVKMEQIAAVKQKISELENQFDFVLIAEEMEESLILLQELTCWSLQDITYLNQNQRKGNERNKMTPKTRYILKKWLWADYMLYEHFEKILQKRLVDFGEEVMQRKVKLLKKANAWISDQCVLSHTDNIHGLSGRFKMAHPIVLGYKVNETKEWCIPYAISEPNFARTLRKEQTERQVNRWLHNNPKGKRIKTIHS